MARWPAPRSVDSFTQSKTSSPTPIGSSSMLRRGQQDPATPPLFPGCDPAALPAGLYTGYYDLALAAQGGCPTGGPPPPFTECHKTLNKDDPNPALSPHGSQPVPGTNMKL